MTARKYRCPDCKPDPAKGVIMIFHDDPDEVATDCRCGGKLEFIGFPEPMFTFTDCRVARSHHQSTSRPG